LEIASSGLAKPTDSLKMPRSYGLLKEAFGHKTCFFFTFIILSYFSTGAFTSSTGEEYPVQDENQYDSTDGEENDVAVVQPLGFPQFGGNDMQEERGILENNFQKRMMSGNRMSHMFRDRRGFGADRMSHLFRDRKSFGADRMNHMFRDRKSFGADRMSHMFRDRRGFGNDRMNHMFRDRKSAFGEDRMSHMFRD